MTAIFKRDLRSLFTNVIGWIFISVLCAFFGLFFLIYNLLNGSPYMSYPLSNICSIVIIVTPILCMRVFTEERKNKTDQLIFTAPVPPIKIIIGKYLSVAATFTMAVLFMAIAPIVLEFYGAGALGQNYTALFGFYLFGLAAIAIALFMSTLTKSQIISVIISFIVLFVAYISDSLFDLIFTEENLLSKILYCISIGKPMQSFLNGVFDLKAVIYYVLLIVLFIFFTYCVIQKRRWSISKNVISRLVSRTLAIIIAIVLFFGINVGISYIPDNYMEFDATSNKVYTISDEGKEFLKNYDHKATIYVLSSESSTDENLKKTLDQFDSSDKITVEYVDMASNPMFASQYTSENLSQDSLIVVGENGNAKAISYDNIYEYSMNQSTYSYDITAYDGEGLIINALYSVVNNSDTVIYTLQGHDEQSLGQNCTTALSKGNYSIKSINLLESDAIPADCGLLVVNAPSKDLSKDDVTKISEYISKGGNVIFNIANVDSTARSIVSINDMPNYKELLSSLHITVKPGVVCEDTQGYYYRQNYALLPEVLESDVSTGIQGKKSVLLYSATAIDYTENNESTLTSLLKTSDGAYIKANLDGSEGSTTEKTDGDETGSFKLGVEETYANGSGIVVYGCQYLFNDEMDSYVYGNNSKLFTNTVTALTKSTDTDKQNVIIPSKSLQTESIMVTGAALIIYGILWGLLIPLASLITGIVIWAIRRKQ